jgi:SNF2 family DNA or RNA helicase
MKDGKLEISFPENPELYEQIDSRLTFISVLGFEYNSLDRKFVMENISDLVGLVSAVRTSIRYFESGRLPYEFDSNIERIIQAAQDSDTQMINSINRWNELNDSNTSQISVPGFVRSLFPYQIRGVLHGLGVDHPANFSVPGSGKTTIAYAIYSILRARGVLDRMVVVGPSSSFMPWEDEYEACFGKGPVSLRVSGDKVDTLEEDFDRSDLVLLTYQMASRITPELIHLMSRSNTFLILDESHNIKRFSGGLWSSSLLKVAPYARKRMILTGTPMPNDYFDLWSQFTFLWPFRNLLKGSSEYKTLAKSKDGRERIKDIVRPFYNRINKRDLNLPSPEFKVIRVPMGKVQQRIYKAIAAKTLADLANPPKERQILRDWRKYRIVRLLQVATNPTLLTKYSEEFSVPPLFSDNLPISSLIQQYPEYEIPSKMVETAKMTREIMDGGQKVLIWTAFIHNIKMLQGMLSERNPLIIYGGIPKDEREDQVFNRENIIREFKNDPNPRVLIANPSSLSESVSLQKVCMNAIYLDRTFNAGQYIQSLDRIHRIGLAPTDVVKYYILIAANSVDEAVHSRLNLKFSRLLELLNDELPMVDLGSDPSLVSEVSDQEFEKDFEAVCRHLTDLRDVEMNASKN